MQSRLDGVAVMSLRVLTWCCVVVLAVLSLMPAEEMVRTGLPGQLEHSIAYAGSAALGERREYIDVGAIVAVGDSRADAATECCPNREQRTNRERIGKKPLG